MYSELNDIPVPVGTGILNDIPVPDDILAAPPRLRASPRAGWTVARNSNSSRNIIVIVIAIVIVIGIV